MKILASGHYPQMKSLSVPTVQTFQDCMIMLICADGGGMIAKVGEKEKVGISRGLHGPQRRTPLYTIIYYLKLQFLGFVCFHKSLTVNRFLAHFNIIRPIGLPSISTSQRTSTR